MTTIRDVADLAGVSTATVSHVINDTRAVSAAARERVLTAMAELDYRPDAVARSLRVRETLTLGLIVPNIEIPFFARVARHIERAANQAGYSVILCNSEWSHERELFYLDNMLARRVDGLVCISLAMRGEHVAPVLQRGTPVVLFDRETMPGIELDGVGIDNFKGAYDATMHLIDLGHRAIGCITGLSKSVLSANRIAGYRQALHDRGLLFDPDLIYPGDYTAPTGLAGAKALLARDQRPTAIFAFSDMMAVGVLQALHECGLRAPDDIAVIGFDGVSLTEHICPPLSTVEQPIPQMSEVAINLLLERINGTAPSEARVVVFEPKLVARASTIGYGNVETWERDNVGTSVTEDVRVQNGVD